MKAVAALMLMTAVVFVATGFKKNDEKNSGATGGKPSSFVDLGLPSGTLWAKWNVGASCPEEAGDQFIWGETNKPKSGIDVEYSRPGQVLEERDDAATANWGKNWRTPTIEEWKELKRCCAIRSTEQGCYVVGPNGNSIFLPYTNQYWSATFARRWGDSSTGYFIQVVRNYIDFDENSSIGYPGKKFWVRPVLKYTKDEYMMMSIEKQLGN